MTGRSSQVGFDQFTVGVDHNIEDQRAAELFASCLVGIIKVADALDPVDPLAHVRSGHEFTCTRVEVLGSCFFCIVLDLGAQLVCQTCLLVILVLVLRIHQGNVIRA